MEWNIDTILMMLKYAGAILGWIGMIWKWKHQKSIERGLKAVTAAIEAYAEEVPEQGKIVKNKVTAVASEKENQVIDAYIPQKNGEGKK